MDRTKIVVQDLIPIVSIEMDYVFRVSYFNSRSASCLWSTPLLRLTRPRCERFIYTTNAIESLHMRLRKIIKTRRHFPSDEAASKLIYLALRNITKQWKMSTREWKSAMTQSAILFPGGSCSSRDVNDVQLSCTQIY